MIKDNQGIFHYRQVAILIDFHDGGGAGEGLHGVIAHDLVADGGSVPGQGIGAAMLHAPLNIENLADKQLLDRSIFGIDVEFYVIAQRDVGKYTRIRVDHQ